MTQRNTLEYEQLDPVLGQLVSEHQDKVVAWIKGEPGAWGYLAGHGVTTARRHLGRSLTDPERRLVWRRLWWFLEQIKAQLLEPG
jgi:hypothetical protein